MNGVMIAFWVIATTLSASLGALALKGGMNKVKKLSLMNLLKTPLIYLGAILYILSAGANIILLTFIDYSIAFPMTSLTYVWTVFISYLVFKEKITLQKILAIVLIAIGFVFLNMNF